MTLRRKNKFLVVLLCNSFVCKFLCTTRIVKNQDKIGVRKVLPA